jgi:signal transduction histidine kinase
VKVVSWKKAARVALPILIAATVIMGLYINASISYAETPHAKGGVLELAAWNRQGVFEITGEWEFYWDKALTDTQLKNGTEDFVLVEAPGEWNYYDTALGALPGTGRATYRLHVTGAQAGTPYGVRVQNMASAYRLYADGVLLAQNGTFGDKADAPVSAYRPQLAVFTPESDSFDLILQIGNEAYAVGGMWEPVIFGTAGQVGGFNTAISGVAIAAVAAIAVMCLFFLIFFSAQRRERDVLTLAGIGVLVILQFSVCGDTAVAALLPDMPIAGFGWIAYISLIWIQFLLLYFIYCAFGGLVRKWQLVMLLSYAGLVTLCVVLLPFEVITSAAPVFNIILLAVFLFITVLLARAAWQKKPGGAALLGAMALNLAMTLYAMFVTDISPAYYILTNTAPEYLVLFFVQCFIVARRYQQAQKLEISLLKSQIRPHFLHNALTTIISVSRRDTDRARDLLTEFSSYLRGFYDYEADELITAGQELELVRAYVALEQARFGERVKVRYEIDSENLLLPPLILQPLVENAFIHGLREKEGGGTVLVYIKRMAEGKARIGVRDDGVGLQVKGSDARQGVGIANIDRRLSRLYRTQLTFIVPEGGGCEVRMEIPWKETTTGACVTR